MFYSYLTDDNHLIDFGMTENNTKLSFRVKDYYFDYRTNHSGYILCAIDEKIGEDEHVSVDYHASAIEFVYRNYKIGVIVRIWISKESKKIDNASLVNRKPKSHEHGTENVILHYLTLVQQGHIDTRLNWKFPLNYL